MLLFLCILARTLFQDARSDSIWRAPSRLNATVEARGPDPLPLRDTAASQQYLLVVGMHLIDPQALRTHETD